MKFTPQHDQMDCGPACLSMIAREYGRKYSLKYLRENSFLTREGVSLLGISEGAKTIGLESFAGKMNREHLKKEARLPCIIHWNQNHFVVLYKIYNKYKFFPFLKERWKYKIADPAHGLITLNEDTFFKSWTSENEEGLILFLHPTEEFYTKALPKDDSLSLRYLLKYLHPFKSQLLQLLLGLLIGSLFTLLFPFITQALVDKGVVNKNIDIIFVLLLAQLTMYFGNATIDIVRNWIFLYIGTRINITIISDFLKKILRLPVKFFDTKMTGDFNQRIGDHERIEHFLTSQSLLTFFSLINLSVFFFVLLLYNLKILLIYCFLTAIAVTWAFLFFRRRKILDYYRFQRRSENQDSIYEIIGGMQEIKLNNFEDYKRNEWEKNQIKLFKVNLRILRLDQLQLNGFDFINHLKNILVTFVAAREVIFGHISIGAMLSISYIIGQMNSPIDQLINFFRSLQDAKLSLERLNEVQNHETEEKPEHIKLNFLEENTPYLSKRGIIIDNLSFQYEGPNSQYILKNINLHIEEGKTMAIVGASGSGKTTLMKLLLKFYDPIAGTIYVNQHKLSNISASNWRRNCGTVMQDGYIFSDTIERNIATDDENINKDKFVSAAITANIIDFLNELPLGVKTKVGASGNGISGGQKQRILIARAVYKNPHYILFDEATSALDAENEKIIHENLQEFFTGKTVVIIAHRLSTVKNADKIVVLKHGEITEMGNHATLVEKRGDYFNLVKNQLELGN